MPTLDINECLGEQYHFENENITDVSKQLAPFFFRVGDTEFLQNVGNSYETVVYIPY